MRICFLGMEVSSGKTTCEEPKNLLKVRLRINWWCIIWNHVKSNDQKWQILGHETRGYKMERSEILTETKGKRPRKGGVAGEGWNTYETASLHQILEIQISNLSKEYRFYFSDNVVIMCFLPLQVIIMTLPRSYKIFYINNQSWNQNSNC